MLGLALLTVLTLVGMARRMAKRGGFGSKASAALRSLAPILLGLGGWFLGALIILTTVQGVPITGSLVVVPSVGVPIGLGLYLAWVNRAWPADRKAAGLAVAAAGAIVGAWLGFHAGGWLFAIITAILGAAAIGNLSLIAFDIRLAQRGRRQVAETEIGQAPPPSVIDTGTEASAS